MVDIHCHILPEVDDGARTWDAAVEMCRIAQMDGIEHVVATPHANARYGYDRDAHEERLSQLRKVVAGALQFSLGCDFHMSYENIQDALQNPARYAIGNTQYLLVEFSDFSLPPTASQLLFELMGVGLMPIITHPERNPLLQRKPELVVKWARMGALVQVTANSLTGRWGKTAGKMVEYLAKHRAIHVIASDAHDVRHRPPILSEGRAAIFQLMGEEAAQALVEDNPRAIVAGEPLPYC